MERGECSHNLVIILFLSFFLILSNHLKLITKFWFDTYLYIWLNCSYYDDGDEGLVSFGSFFNQGSHTWLVAQLPIFIFLGVMGGLFGALFKYFLTCIHMHHCRKKKESDNWLECNIWLGDEVGWIWDWRCFEKLIWSHLEWKCWKRFSSLLSLLLSLIYYHFLFIRVGNSNYPYVLLILSF
jgi:hypothetical protein